MGKRRFGRVRRLPSGQYQARYAGPDGIDRPAPQTFTSKGDAEIWLTMKEAEIRRGDWTDPEAGKVRFGDYAANWISDHVFKPRTECFAQSEKDGGLVFVGPLGGRLRRSNFRRFWYKARDAVDLPELHFHDLRHTGNTMAAAQGASLRELMERMGHSSTRAALIYLHATQERDQAIAAGMGKLLSDARKTGRRPNRSGTQRARGRRSAS